MSNIEDTLWQHLVEHHDADRAQLPVAASSPGRRRGVTIAVAATGLAAAGAVGVLAISSGSGSPTTGRSHSGASRISAHAAVSPGPVRSEDVGYIIRRVNARVAAEGADGTVIHTDSYADGGVSANGTLTGLAMETDDGYGYTAANGAYYWHNAMYNSNGDGSVYLYENYVYVRGASGRYTFTGTLIDPATHTYSQNVEPNSAPFRGPSPNQFSTPSQVQHSLQSGHVTEQGMASIDGTPAIALSVDAQDPSSAGSITLYVDAQTYQPLRTLVSFPSGHDLTVTDWEPASAANIATAEDDTIPSGYTRVAKLF